MPGMRASARRMALVATFAKARGVNGRSSFITLPDKERPSGTLTARTSNELHHGIAVMKWLA